MKMNKYPQHTIYLYQYIHVLVNIPSRISSNNTDMEGMTLEDVFIYILLSSVHSTFKF